MNVSFPILLAAVGCCVLAPGECAVASATSFQEPATWSRGDANSTYQEWDSGASVFLNAETPPTSALAEPSLGAGPSLGVAVPGFTASSGGYYSFSGPYQTAATIYNHGGTYGNAATFGSMDGTRVLIQTATTLNTDLDVGIVVDAVEILDLAGATIPGGANEELLRTEELFRGEVESTFGIVPQQELLFEFWLPGFTGDFQVVLGMAVHSSFQHLRVDSIIETSAAANADFNDDGAIDGSDFLVWQRGFGMSPGTAAPGEGDANADRQVDGADLDAWQQQ
ncbi:MAG: hypothetical protein KDA44_23060, partial [Planctomycetales bacterium]|nr:hypothetical protein [Planctomycetales bacterium]